MVSLLKECHSRKVRVFVGTVAIVDVGVDGHITSLTVQTTEELDLRTEVFVAAITHRLVVSSVKNHVFQQ